MFAANICSDDVRVGRPSPYMIFHAMEASGIDSVRQVLNVGDTPLDIQAGSRAVEREWSESSESSREYTKRLAFCRNALRI
jgi:phosphoglycolate phosphatase-like HAD superfamily hydrolase